MNKWWIVLALGLTVVGCAEGVDEPNRPGPTAPEPYPPSPVVLSGELNQGKSTKVDFKAPPLLLQAPTVGPLPEPGPVEEAH